MSSRIFTPFDLSILEYLNIIIPIVASSRGVGAQNEDFSLLFPRVSFECENLTVTITHHHTFTMSWTHTHELSTQLSAATQLADYGSIWPNPAHQKLGPR